MPDSNLIVLAQNNANNVAAGVAAGIVVVMMLIYLAVLVVIFVSFWKLFIKAGRPGWEAIVPIYNFYILVTKIAIRPWWLCLSIVLVMIPFVNIIGAPILLAVSILISIDVAKNFGKEIPFAIGLALLPFVFYPILAFGSAKFEPKPKEILPQLV